ncbi:Trafficking protein particle complex subunit 10 [Pleurostoma richardsiae]|uniref:Trafficking protein particle complex subunit 10 n=1 Tax=Pleurostoma richardsiae TaxID=41990 RepID=A0AA38VDY1_9PEZI|nr:Trafficking protein particle complex subunit 10 [Pleurostoma richardsiae]
MEQPFSTSKVTVEYYDPHDVYKLLAPGFIPRLPLRNLHWQSHAGPLRSIETLHVELVAAGSQPPTASLASPITSPRNQPLSRSDSTAARDDGFTTQSIGGHAGSMENIDAAVSPASTSRPTRRHQIPGLRRTPYLKILLVRCDDNDTYKSTVRSEIREWIKEHTPPAQASRKDRSSAENHDAFEWLIVHVVIPNTVAATQPRASGSGASGIKAVDSSTDSLPTTKSSASRWRGGSSTLLEKLRADFNGTSKSTVDRIAQIRIGINDVPYDILPKVVPAIPTGYSETEVEAEAAWVDLIAKFQGLILSSFDMRVTQYEEDIKEKDAQRALPGWNFCTFFILKEGLARGFESVGLVEDALVGYDELSVGLDTVIQEQALAGDPEAHGGALLSFTEELKKSAQKALSTVSTGTMEFEEDGEPVDLQSGDTASKDVFDDIPISASRKPYRDLILANNVSVFDFRCYIFARQIALLLRLGNAWSSREELLAKLKEQQDSVLHGVAPRAPPPKHTDEPENLSMLAEICRRTLEFVPVVSQVIRKDIISAFTDLKTGDGQETSNPQSHPSLDPVLSEIVDNIVASFAFSIAQQILAQTSSKSLPIPPSIIPSADGQEQKASIPEPKTIMHPARSSSMRVGPTDRPGPPKSPGIFPGPGRRASASDTDAAHHQFLKAGLEELAARRAELYTVSRNILEELGKKRGWSDGWSSAPVIDQTGVDEMEEVSLDSTSQKQPASHAPHHTLEGLDSRLLRTALDNKEDFYRLYETLTDKALRHFTVANHIHSVKASMTDMAVLKYHLQDYAAAADCFLQTTPFFGESGWSLLELSMLVMYSRCLRELQRQQEYIRVVLKLLSKAAEAEKERLGRQGLLRIGSTVQKETLDLGAIRGFLTDLLAASKSAPSEVRVVLESFFTEIEIDGPPTYDDGQDSYSLTLKLRSLLPDDLPMDKATLRLFSPAISGAKEIWLTSGEAVVLKPGKNKIRLHSRLLVPGNYEADRVHLVSSNVGFYYEREVSHPHDRSTSTLKNPRVLLYQRADSVDVRLSTAKNQQLDRNNELDLELTTGWNEMKNCEMRVRAATGGLRLLTHEARIENDAHKPSKPPEGGSFHFFSVPANTSLKITFPFTVEQDVLNVSLKVEVTYTTDRGTFTLTKTPFVSIALPLGVNVQDVFKHDALFSRFTVSTASSGPLRLYSSSLLESDVFASQFGVPPTSPVVIFPKQPASLMYKIVRKPGSKIGPKTKKTMYLKLVYSQFHEELRSLVESSLTKALAGTDLWQYSRFVISRVLAHVQTALTAYDLERAALLSELHLSFLADINWEKQFSGLGGHSARGAGTVARLATFLVEWVKRHLRLQLMASEVDDYKRRCILIPVDIPSISVVHTADIRLQHPMPALMGSADGTGDLSGTPTACINQLVAATLHLRWTRIWNTEPATDVGPDGAEDLEFSYEVTAPMDTWLLGGRRKGHFVIPSSPSADASSTPGTEADIPLLLVPLREGWLPYPAVEVRAVRGGADGEPVAPTAHGHCETDYRNLGETVRVFADRARVTVSLDASGPGGGPLVLESVRRSVAVGRVIA